MEAISFDDLVNELFLKLGRTVVAADAGSTVWSSSDLLNMTDKDLEQVRKEFNV